MGLCGKVKDGIDVMHFESIHDLVRLSNVSMGEGEVWQGIKGPGIVKRGTVVDFVE